MMLIDIEGKKFGRLLIVGLKEIRNGRAFWECRCDCGNTLITRADALKTGRTKSCGCWSRECAYRHGGKGTPEFKVWQSMLQRCNNANDESYPRYGGRGIEVCVEWLKFENFIADMGKRPTMDHSLDRRNNDGNYEPGNCRWATRVEQQNNRHNTALLAYNGEVKPLTAWARQFGLRPGLVWMRVFRYKWAISKALTTPTRGGVPSYF